MPVYLSTLPPPVLYRLPMTDDDRFRLLFGPYQTPVFKYGGI